MSTVSIRNQGYCAYLIVMMRCGIRIRVPTPTPKKVSFLEPVAFRLGQVLSKRMASLPHLAALKADFAIVVGTRICLFAMPRPLRSLFLPSKGMCKLVELHHLSLPDYWRTGTAHVGLSRIPLYRGCSLLLKIRGRAVQTGAMLEMDLP